MINNFDKAHFEISVRVALNTMCTEMGNQASETVALIERMDSTSEDAASEMKTSYELLENRRIVQSFLRRVLLTELSDNMDMSIHHGKGGRSVIEIAFKDFPNEQIRASLVTSFYEQYSLRTMESMVRELVKNRLSTMDHLSKAESKQNRGARDLIWFNKVASRHDGSESDLFVNTKVYYARLFFKIASKVSTMSDLTTRTDLIHAMDVMSSLQRTLTDEFTYVGDWSDALMEYLNGKEKSLIEKQIDDLEQILSAQQRHVDDLKKRLEEIGNKNNLTTE